MSAPCMSTGILLHTTFQDFYLLVNVGSFLTSLLKDLSFKVILKLRVNKKGLQKLHETFVQNLDVKDSWKSKVNMKLLERICKQKVTLCENCSILALLLQNVKVIKVCHSICGWQLRKCYITYKFCFLTF